MAGECSGGESDSTPFTNYYGLQRFDFARSSLEEIHGQRNGAFLQAISIQKGSTL
jgi:tRNA(Glu) U13 pseudouridine synthase TruD